MNRDFLGADGLDGWGVGTDVEAEASSFAGEAPWVVDAGLNNMFFMLKVEASRVGADGSGVSTGVGTGTGPERWAGTAAGSWAGVRTGAGARTTSRGRTRTRGMLALSPQKKDFRSGFFGNSSQILAFWNVFGS